ncbi:MAG: serine/threonine protein kinase [Acidobacteria bacterium]|nr:serine/threonine protein kinase [Acidobacteriota bacterium]
MENSQNISNTGTNNSSAILRHELIGQTIAEKYEVKRLLGRGGMGAVYEGKHLLLEKPVAIKVMSTELAEDASALSRFMREAKTAAKLEHPNAVTIHDFGVWQENIAYIVMEFISGVSLRDILSKNKTVSPLETVKWMGQICSAVSMAHTLGIIHRDLKPENIMLKQSGDGEPIIKVVDFGLAKIIKDEEGNAANITKTGEVFGTPYYMGPEFYDGELVDHQADIYALGIIAYEMLSGRPPFYGTIEKIIAAHLFQEPRSLADNNPSLQPFDPVIALALKKKRNERLSSATEFANLLKNVLIENPSLAPEGLDALPNPSLFSKNAQELTPTMKQASGPVTLIPKTAKMSTEIPEAQQTLDNEAAKTQANHIGTAKVSVTSQISANTLAAISIENQPTEKAIIPLTASSAIKVNQETSRSTKRIPLAIGVTAGIVFALGGMLYSNSNSSLTPTNSASPLPAINNSTPTPVVKFSDPESPENKNNTDTQTNLNEDPSKTNTSDKKPIVAKPKASPKANTEEVANKNENKNNNKNDNKDNRKEGKNIIVDAASGVGKVLGGFLGKKKDEDKKDRDKKDKKRKDD